MIRKIVLTIVSLSFVLSIAFPRISTVASHETRLYVDPPTIAVAVDQTFTINVSIADVETLYGYDFKLYYNTTILDGLSVTLPPGHFFEVDWIWIDKLEVVDNYNVTHGRVWAFVTCHPPALAPSGSGVLVAISFKVTGVGQSVLDLHDTELASSEALPIPHDVYDGYVEVKLFGDVNYDGIVDIFDGVILGVAFGTKLGDPNWNPDADLNGDDFIDIFDVIIWAKNFGKTW